MLSGRRGPAGTGPIYVPGLPPLHPAERRSARPSAELHPASAKDSARTTATPAGLLPRSGLPPATPWHRSRECLHRHCPPGPAPPAQKLLLPPVPGRAAPCYIPERSPDHWDLLRRPAHTRNWDRRRWRLSSPPFLEMIRPPSCGLRALPPARPAVADSFRVAPAQPCA